MIRVWFCYRVKSGIWKRDFKSFDDMIKAFRFIQKVKHSSNMVIDSYTADDLEVYQWLSERC